MKKFILTIIFFLITTPVFAETFIRASGFLIPSQDFKFIPQRGPHIDIAGDISYGGVAEIGKYSPKKFFSVGFEGGFESLESSNPVPGIKDAKADILSLLGKVCFHLQNKSRFVPFACGGAGMVIVDSHLALNGARGIVGFSPEFSSAHALEAGMSIDLGEILVRGGYRINAGFRDIHIGGLTIDIDRHMVFAGIEF